MSFQEKKLFMQNFCKLQGMVHLTITFDTKLERADDLLDSVSNQVAKYTVCISRIQVTCWLR